MNLAQIQWYGGYLVAHYYVGLEYAAAVVACIILLSSLDDLFIDLWYWIRTLIRRFTVQRTYKPLTAAQLQQREEQPIAIMVPAWHEYDVVAAMIEDLVRVMDYRNYVVFVGTYRNDPQTIAEVERMRRRYKQLRRVEVPHDGPTCKADCLNWVIQAIFVHERDTGIEFAGVVLHDSEDVLHPLELKFFNYLLPRKDMIQLPVASLERNWFELVAGTYMDEFAEWHAKDLVVRESLVGAVPSAGVGTCFSRRALLALIDETASQPFNTDSLTEDYDVGARLGKMGMQSIFARFPVQFATRRKAWFGLGRERDITVTMPLCVREFFPDTFRTAYRQRARWTLGIGLQGWKQTGWSGSLANRYLLFRDRKGIVTAFVGIFAYVLVLQFLGFAGAGLLGWMPDLIASPFADSGWLQALLWINGCALLLRAGQRAYFVTRLYGWEHGVLSVPRMVVGNFINFMAVARAWKLFLTHLVTGRRLAWDKTMHDFPSADGFTNRRQRLGELLLSWQAIDADKLEQALGESHAREAPLGRVLMAKGWLDEETLAEAIAFQADLPRGRLDVTRVTQDAARLPLEAIVRYRVLPQVERTERGAVADSAGESAAFAASAADRTAGIVLLTASPLAGPVLDELAALSGGPIVQRIVREGEIAAGLRVLRGVEVAIVLPDVVSADADTTANADANATAFADAPAPHAPARSVPLIGDLLIEHGHVRREAFEAAMQHYRPDRHGRIGDYMVACDVISRAALDNVIQQQRRLQGDLAAS